MSNPFFCHLKLVALITSAFRFRVVPAHKRFTGVGLTVMVGHCAKSICVMETNMMVKIARICNDSFIRKNT